ncbi:MAG: 2,3-bisphosphoglycerate-independent phosphoglycerate mutase [Deltaproteobacteria bacterium]|nr:2,3-bisphosphoglycerate-independent phosphoglycerate mutase [Deltaproteobacteria bacterium]
MNILLIILDGLADRPQAVLGGKTPLEAAHTPHLDRLAELGTNGLFVPLSPGIPLESEFSHFLLFGYLPEQFPGRAAFEAIGRGFTVPPDAVVLLASFATTTIVDGKIRRETILWEEERSQDESDCQTLCDVIAAFASRGIHFALQSCGRCEAILTLSGNPSRYVSDVDPFYNEAYVARAVPLAEAPDPENAERTAAALNEYLLWAQGCLSAHPVNRRRQTQGFPPVNFLLTKWAAAPPEVPSFQEQNGLRAASVENYPLYLGIARICGMTPVTVTRRETVAEDFCEKLLAAEQLFQQGYEFVHLHAKGPDVAAHRKDPLGKKAAIEAIDSALGPLVRQVESGADSLVVITGDHATPSSGPLIHSGEAVPVLIAGGPNVLVDDVAEFHERAAIRGGLGRVHGTDLMPLMLNLTDRIRLHGVRHQRQARPYWRQQPEPFMCDK